MSSQKHTGRQKGGSYKHGRKKGVPNLAGKLIVCVQLLLTVLFAAVLWSSGMVPNKYMAILLIVLLILFGALFAMQYLKSKVYIVGIVISVLISIGLALGSYYMAKANQLLADVGGATYKTDNMIVVVRKDDASDNIMDAKSYTFGIQTSTDQENNQKMVEDLTKVMGAEPDLKEFVNVQAEAEALLNGEIGAAIYNQAFEGIIEDAVEGYSDQVRILYQYGIETEIVQETTSEQVSVREPFNIYISGIDVDGPITTNSRSDVNIIMTVNPNTHKILLTTTPRDYYVTIPGISGEQRDKLTHAGIYGVDASMATLENIYGIDIAYYARVNFTSLVEIVDALGGVDVYSEYEFTGRGQHFDQGYNHVDGEAALKFARERYSFESGDNQRGKNQEALLTAILQKAMTPAILANASQLITSVSDSVETNMTRAEMAEFINVQLSDAATWDIQSVAAVGSGDNQACYSSGDQLLYVMWPDESSVASISEKMQQVMNEK